MAADAGVAGILCWFVIVSVLLFGCLIFFTIRSNQTKNDSRPLLLFFRLATMACLIGYCLANLSHIGYLAILYSDSDLSLFDLHIHSKANRLLDISDLLWLLFTLIGRCGLYLLFLGRLHYTFNESMYAYNVRMLTIFGIFICILALSVLIGFIIESEIDSNHTHVAIFAAVAVFIDMCAAAALLYLFIRQMFDMILQTLVMSLVDAYPPFTGVEPKDCYHRKLKKPQSNIQKVSPSTTATTTPDIGPINPTEKAIIKNIQLSKRVHPNSIHTKIEVPEISDVEGDLEPSVSKSRSRMNKMPGSPLPLPPKEIRTEVETRVLTSRLKLPGGQLSAGDATPPGGTYVTKKNPADSKNIVDAGQIYEIRSPDGSTRQTTPVPGKGLPTMPDVTLPNNVVKKTEITEEHKSEFNDEYHIITTTTTTKTIYKQYPTIVPKISARQKAEKQRKRAERRAANGPGVAFPIRESIIQLPHLITESELNLVCNDFLEKSDSFRRRTVAVTLGTEFDLMTPKGNAMPHTFTEDILDRAQTQNCDVGHEIESITSPKRPNIRLNTAEVSPIDNEKNRDRIAMARAQSNFKQTHTMSTLDMINRYTVLSAVAIITSVLWGIIGTLRLAMPHSVALIYGSMSVVAMDELINVVCVVLMYNFARKSYYRLCNGLHRFVERFFVWRAKVALLAKQKEINKERQAYYSETAVNE